MEWSVVWCGVVWCSECSVVEEWWGVDSVV